MQIIFRENHERPFPYIRGEMRQKSFSVHFSRITVFVLLAAVIINKQKGFGIGPVIIEVSVCILIKITNLKQKSCGDGG